MEVAEILEAKKNLELEIKELLHSFHDKTGVYISQGLIINSATAVLPDGTTALVRQDITLEVLI